MNLDGEVIISCIGINNTHDATLVENNKNLFSVLFSEKTPYDIITHELSHIFSFITSNIKNAPQNIRDEILNSYTSSDYYTQKGYRSGAISIEFDPNIINILDKSKKITPSDLDLDQIHDFIRNPSDQNIPDYLKFKKDFLEAVIEHPYLKKKLQIKLYEIFQKR